MKSLYLLRHAKSSWDEPSVPDHDRPLAPRGREASRRLAAYAAKAKIRPQLVLCSSALRARQTYEALAGALGAPEVSVEEGIYGASSEELVGRVRQVRSDVGSLMLVGHNPGLGELAAGLAGDGAATALNSLEGGFPAGALATLRFAGEWEDLGFGCAYLEGLVLPRELPAEDR